MDLIQTLAAIATTALASTLVLITPARNGRATAIGASVTALALVPLVAQLRLLGVLAWLLAGIVPALALLLIKARAARR